MMGLTYYDPPERGQEIELVLVLTSMQTVHPSFIYSKTWSLAGGAVLEACKAFRR